jgi:hypothetical protein
MEVMSVTETYQSIGSLTSVILEHLSRGWQSPKEGPTRGSPWAVAGLDARGLPPPASKFAAAPAGCGGTAVPERKLARVRIPLQVTPGSHGAPRQQYPGD